MYSVCYNSNKAVICMRKQARIIIVITIFVCVCMGFVDAVIQPGYIVKSAIKMLLFLCVPILYAIYNKSCNFKKLFVPNKSGLLIAILLGVGVYSVVLGAYFVFRNIFDFSALTSSLTESTGVDRSNFLIVALYISFANSFLEEFFFRGFSFLTLKEVSSRKLAYSVSAALFSLYHIAMMIGWFDLPVVLLALIGLFVGGLIFNYINEKFNTIYLSWLIHMFANFATNTIGYILFNI